jgi:hypothetical protein
MTATRALSVAAARRTSRSVSSNSARSAVKGRPASGPGRRLSSRLKRSISSVTRGSTVCDST